MPDYIRTESAFSEDSSTQIKAMKKMSSIRWIEAILDIALLAGFISAMGLLVRLAFWAGIPFERGFAAFLPDLITNCPLAVLDQPTFHAECGLTWSMLEIG
jgi:hypothetical protein